MICHVDFDLDDAEVGWIFWGDTLYLYMGGPRPAPAECSTGDRRMLEAIFRNRRLSDQVSGHRPCINDLPFTIR